MSRDVVAAARQPKANVDGKKRTDESKRSYKRKKHKDICEAPAGSTQLQPLYDQKQEDVLLRGSPQVQPLAQVSHTHKMTNESV